MPSAQRSDKIPGPSPVQILTSVANVRTGEFDVYIGRAMPGKFEASKWANPIKIAKDTPENRAYVKARYLAHVYGTRLIGQIGELKGQRIGCWCYPQACHGDVLAELANAIHHDGGACPHCQEPVKATINIMGIATRRIAEYWRCPRCFRYGWIERGTITSLDLPADPQSALL